jgi:glutamyl-tRNA synthetase
MPSDVARRVASGLVPAWRFRVDRAGVVPFTDRVRMGVYEADPGSIGDFVVLRADGVPAYQLAVVVDDIAMRISEVVRGEDLLASTVRQLLLYKALGTAPPVFAHVPLLLGDDGTRLSKRHRGVTLRELRDAGGKPRRRSWEAWPTGTAFARPQRQLPARDLVDGFDLAVL